jgi:hypothetical protein
MKPGKPLKHEKKEKVAGRNGHGLEFAFSWGRGVNDVW